MFAALVRWHCLIVWIQLLIIKTTLNFFIIKNNCEMRNLGFLAFLLLLSSVVMAQTRQLSGTITDGKTGSPLAGVTVSVKGRNTQTITNTDGGFPIKLPAGAASLEFSSV